jgi:hypothetical protein
VVLPLVRDVEAWLADPEKAGTVREPPPRALAKPGRPAGRSRTAALCAPVSRAG